MALLTELLIGVGYGLMAGAPMMLAFAWTMQALGSIPQPSPQRVPTSSQWQRRPRSMRLLRSS